MVKKDMPITIVDSLSNESTAKFMRRLTAFAKSLQQEHRIGDIVDNLKGRYKVKESALYNAHTLMAKVRRDKTKFVAYWATPCIAQNQINEDGKRRTHCVSNKRYGHTRRKLKAVCELNKSTKKCAGPIKGKSNPFAKTPAQKAEWKKKTAQKKTDQKKTAQKKTAQKKSGAKSGAKKGTTAKKKGAK